MTRLISEGLLAWQMPAHDSVLRDFERFSQLLLEKNRDINLTALTEEADIAALHFLDCLSLFRAAPLSGSRIVDVGSGAGFPAVPLKLYDRTVSLTALDSAGKRIAFLDEVRALFALNDFTCLQARAEELGLLPGCRDSYDYAVSRAVAGLNILCELCLPFVRQGGAFLAMKGTSSDEELAAAGNAIRSLGGRLEKTFDYTIPGTDVTHRIIIIRKISQTPQGYPRRFAKISKSPL